MGGQEEDDEEQALLLPTEEQQGEPKQVTPLRRALLKARRPLAAGAAIAPLLVVACVLARGLGGRVPSGGGEGLLVASPSAAIGAFSSSSSLSSSASSSPPSSSSLAVSADKVKATSSGEDEDELLEKARASYSPAAAAAFASMAKTAYCGPLPGVFAAVAASCGRTPAGTAATSCEVANFTVVPGSVRMVVADDSDVRNAVFGIVAKTALNPDAKSKPPPVKPGCVVVFRGTVDNYANSLRDHQTGTVGGLTNCTSCGVHQGYKAAYDKVGAQLRATLDSLLCSPEVPDNNVYVVGHGSGAALATLAAWELKQAGYNVAGGYLFASPRVGNATMAKAMYKTFTEEGVNLYDIVFGRDSTPFWPEVGFKSVGHQVYYPSLHKTNYTFCKVERDGGNGFCGVGAVSRQLLTSKDRCISPLAPNGTFCDFTGFASKCYGGRSSAATPLHLEDAIGGSSAAPTGRREVAAV